MKTNKIKIALFTGLLTLGISCEWGDMNDSLKEPISVNPETLVTNGTKELTDALVSTNVNENVIRLMMQYYQQNTYTDESNYDYQTRNIPGGFWENLYRHALMDLKQARALMSIEAEANKGSIAIIDVLEAYANFTLISTFGDVPYSEALGESLAPNYDDGLEIAKAEIESLQNAISTFSSDGVQGLSTVQDAIYGGSVAKWKKYANSLLLKYAMLIAEVDEATAKAIVSGIDVEDMILENEDNAAFHYGGQPNNNPLHTDFVLSGRNDFNANSTMVAVLKEDNDSRLEKFYESVEDDYVGLNPGEGGAYANHSQITHRLSKNGESEPGVHMSAAEVNFLIAEAISRGFSFKANASSAENHYNNAVEASFDFWDASGADEYLAGAGKFDAANWKTSIGRESWKAFFNRPLESWVAYRKYDAPSLTPPQDNEANITVLPTRLYYPVSETNLNGANKDKAEAKIKQNNPGKQDNALDSKLFWDKN